MRFNTQKQQHYRDNTVNIYFGDGVNTVSISFLPSALLQVAVNSSSNGTDVISKLPKYFSPTTSLNAQGSGKYIGIRQI